MPSTGNPGLDLGLMVAAAAPVAYMTKHLGESVFGEDKASSGSENPKGGEQGKQGGGDKAANPEKKKN